jgi:hypothetical protein
MTDTKFSVQGFIDDHIAAPPFDAETQSEADVVFNERVSRGDIEVTLYKMDGPMPLWIKEVCRYAYQSSFMMQFHNDDDWHNG